MHNAHNPTILIFSLTYENNLDLYLNILIVDSGVYTCLAANTVGQIKREFYLTVEAPHVELPVIKHTTNSTVYQVR